MNESNTYARREYEAVGIRILYSSLQKIAPQLCTAGVGLCGSTEVEIALMGNTEKWSIPGNRVYQTTTVQLVQQHPKGCYRRYTEMLPVRPRLFTSARNFNTDVCIADSSRSYCRSVWPTWYQMGSGCQVGVRRSLRITFLHRQLGPRCLTLLEPQSRSGDNPVKFQVVLSPNGTAVLKGLMGWAHCGVDVPDGKRVPGEIKHTCKPTVVRTLHVRAISSLVAVDYTRMYVRKYSYHSDRKFRRTVIQMFNPNVRYVSGQE